MKKIVLSLSMLIYTFVYGQFGEKHTLNHACSKIFSIIPVDYDSDNDNDVFVTYNENKIIYYENMGNDSLANEKIISSSSFRVINCADINNDGRIELLCTNNGSIGWFENNLNNNFDVFHTLSAGTGAIYACDIDIDGDSDLFVSFYSSNKVSWYENLGNGVFGPENIISSTVTNVANIQFIDLNNDGHKDFVATSYPQLIICSFINNGAETFSQNMIWNDYLSSYDDINFKPEFYDIDGDGYLDIFHSNSLVVYQLNNGDGTFSSNYNILNDINHTSSPLFYIGDLNNDNDPDLIYGSDGTAFPPSSSIFSIEISNKPVQNINYDYFYETSNFVIIDFNNDGSEDIIEGTLSGRLFWYPNDGNFNFNHQIALNPRSYYPNMFWAVDYDNDSDTDIVCLYNNESFLALYENTGNGNFLPEKILIDSIIANSPYMQTNSLTDIDNDGDYDLIYTNSSFGIANNYPEGIYIFKNNSGVWDTTIIDTTNIVNYKLVDINNDNFKDIVYSNNYGINALINNGTGSFTTFRQLYNPGINYSNFILFDLDQDGDLDLLGTSDSLQWIINDGSGNYTSRINLLYYGCLGGYMDIHPVDIDNDSDNDIIFNTPCSIYLLKNDGTNNFTTNILYQNNNAGIFKSYLIDIDKDGDLDIVYLSNNNGVYWIENVNGVFSTFQNLLLSAPNHSYYFDLANLDNDNAPDLILKFQNNELNWYKNYFTSKLKVKGNIYYDSNQNGVKDSTEQGFLHTQVMMTPGYLTTYSDQTGNYWAAVDTGTYHVSTIPLNHWQITSTPSSYDVNITFSHQIADSCDFGLYPDSIFSEIDPDIIFGWGICNDYAQYWIHLKNTGTLPANGIIELELDTMIDFILAEIPQDSIVNNKVYWHFSNLNFFDELNFFVETTWPLSTFMGSNIINHINVFITDSNNNITSTFADSSFNDILCSYDPNYKTVEPFGSTSEHIIPVDQDLEYTIHFQNTGNTNAVNITITDTLSNSLDVNSFEFMSSSHPVRIQQLNRLITFTFDSIMLPDSSANEFLSHGYIKYKIKPANGVLPKSKIYNTAYIYFDYNPAIVTDTTISTIECYILPSIPAITNNNGTLYAPYSFGYQWYFNGIPISGAVLMSYHPQQDGNYSVEVFNQYGCSSMSNSINYILNINSTSSNSTFNISPNPSSKKITVKWDKYDVSNITILNTSGQIALNKDVHNTNFIEIDISNLPKGVYIVKATGKNDILTNKLVIN